MKKHLPLIIIFYSVFYSGYAFSDNCTLHWGSTMLETGITGPKGGYGDTHTAYAIFGIEPDATTVYRIKGEFPYARYMSIESSELRTVAGTTFSWDFDAIQDHEITPDLGSTNPFTPGEELSVQPRNFTVDVVPAGAQWPDAINRLDVPTNEFPIRIWLRIVLPNNTPLTREDLPIIEAYDLATGSPKECLQAQFVNTPESITETEDLRMARAIYDVEFFGPQTDSADLKSSSAQDDVPQELLLSLTFSLVPEKWWPFDFKVIENFRFEGNSAIPGYSYGLTQMASGKVALVKFKAPTHVDTGPDATTFDPEDKDMRYWSLCVLDIFNGKGLACLPDSLTKKDDQGFVTIVYGPAGGAVESKAKTLGYNFLPDNREALGIPDQPLTLVYRQILPSESFSQTSLHKGKYLPTARVCSSKMFLLGFCDIR